LISLLKETVFKKGDLKKALMFAQSALYKMPSNMKYRIELATMMIQYEASQKVIALLSSYNDVPQDPQLLSERQCLLAVAYALGDSADGMRLALSCAQKAIMVLPYSTRSWQTLGFVRSQAASYLQSISMQV
jgi:predicted Zn-dependent protease